LEIGEEGFGAKKFKAAATEKKEKESYNEHLRKQRLRLII